MQKYKDVYELYKGLHRTEAATLWAGLSEGYKVGQIQM